MSPLKKVADSGSSEVKEEDVIEKAISPIGPWQLIIIAAITSCELTVSWHHFAIIFLAPPPTFWCARPPEFKNISVDLWKNISSPEATQACLRYNFTADDLSIPGFVSSSVDTIPCNDWEFDTQIFESTIISQWNMVCDREFLAHFSQTFYMFGAMIGSFLSGVISDKAGRKTTFIAASILQLLSGTIAVLSTNFPTFLFLRFLEAIATSGIMLTTFVIAVELVGHQWRAAFVILYHVGYSLGHLTLPAFSYFLRDWKYFQLAISAPSIVLITYFWVIPESPRWLLNVDRVEEAKKIIEKAAKRNHMSVSNLNELFQNRAKNSLESTESASFWDLFKYRNLRIKTLCMAFNWLTIGVCFFGLGQYLGRIKGNIFMNVALGASIEIPVCFLSLYAYENWGRRSSLIASHCITTVSCLLIIAVPNDITWPTATLANIGYISMTVAFSTIYLYAGELFPTVVRNAGCGICSASARIGSMAAPFISGLSSTATYMPPLIFGIFPIVAGLLCFLLPETLNTVLPETIQDGNRSCSKKRAQSNDVI